MFLRYTMVTKDELKKLEMSYPLKINRLLRGAFISPCPDCKSSFTDEMVDCDEWCLKNCVHPIEREILSERQKALHNERRHTTLQGAIRMLAELKENMDISDPEYRKKIEEVAESLRK